MGRFPDPALERPRPHGRSVTVASIFPVLLADLRSEDLQRKVVAAEELLLYQDHLQAGHIQRLVPEFKQLLLVDLQTEQDAQLCAAAAAFFTPLAEVCTLHCPAQPKA